MGETSSAMSEWGDQRQARCSTWFPGRVVLNNTSVFVFWFGWWDVHRAAGGARRA